MSGSSEKLNTGLITEPERLEVNALLFSDIMFYNLGPTLTFDGHQMHLHWRNWSWSKNKYY